MGDARARAAARLGVDESRLTPLAGSSAAELDRFEAIVKTAMETEDKAFDQAIDDALRFVPRLLRGPAQKLLFPGGRRG